MNLVFLKYANKEPKKLIIINYHIKEFNFHLVDLLELLIISCKEGERKE